MRIIKLGDVKVVFGCPKCNTIFEIESSELKEPEGYCVNYKYYVECPLCEHRIEITDEHEIVDIIKKRKMLL